MKVPTLGHRVTGYTELQGSAAGDSMISVYLSSFRCGILAQIRAACMPYIFSDLKI
jgi:hypothetical protein